MNIILSNIRFNHSPSFSSDKTETTTPQILNERDVIPVYGDDEIRTAPAQLSLFHMHDFHGQNIRMERAYSAVRQFDNNMLKNQNAIFSNDLAIDKLKLCSGDMFLGGNINELAVVNEFLNIAGVLANTIGNHECDADIPEFADIIKNRNYRLIGLNMHPDSNNDIDSIRSNSFIAEIHGNKYGIVGLVPLDMSAHVKNDDVIKKFNISDIEHSITDLKEDIKLLKEQGVNKIILLSHVGLDNDKYIAQNISDVDIILGGHSHDLLNEIKEGENLFYSPKGEPVVIMQVGRDGEYINIPNIKFNELGQITGIQYNVVKTDDFPRNYIAKTDFDNILGNPEVVGRIAKVEKFNKNMYINENPHCDFILDCIMSELGSDIAIMNSANARSSFVKGNVDTRELRLITPFANKMTVIKISEKELVDRLNYLIEESLKSTDNRPGILQVAGMKYTYSKSQRKMTELYLVDNNGKETEINIDSPNTDKFYTIAADDFCVKNDYAGLDLKERLNNPILFLDYDKDTIVANYLRKHKEPVQIKSDGRIKVVD